jgi:hypothetical protein
MKHIHSRIPVLAILLLVGPLFAAKFWETKPYTDWTDKECLELLTKSPWTFSSAFGSTIGMKDAMPGLEIPESGAGAQRAEKAATFGEREASYIFEFRFLTATPIRMAMARIRLLQKPGDAALQQELERFVKTTPDKIIAIEFGCRANPPGDSGLHDIVTYLNHATIADLRDATYLMSSPGNKQLPLAEFLAVTPTRSRPVLVFPRVDEKGNPNFSGEEKSILLRTEFSIEVKGKSQKFNVFGKLNPKQMVYQGRFVL